MGWTVESKVSCSAPSDTAFGGRNALLRGSKIAYFLSRERISTIDDEEIV